MWYVCLWVSWAVLIMEPGPKTPQQVAADDPSVRAALQVGTAKNAVCCWVGGCRVRPFCFCEKVNTGKGTGRERGPWVMALQQAGRMTGDSVSGAGWAVCNLLMDGWMSRDRKLCVQVCRPTGQEPSAGGNWEGCNVLGTRRGRLRA